jgi:hypothetical protein
MNTAIPESSGHDNPKSEDLAGVPASVEEDHPAIRGPGSQDPQIARTRGHSIHVATVRKSVERWPTADDLAGIPVCAEEDENQTAQPRKRHPKR